MSSVWFLWIIMSNVFILNVFVPSGHQRRLCKSVFVSESEVLIVFFVFFLMWNIFRFEHLQNHRQKHEHQKNFKHWKPQNCVSSRRGGLYLWTNSRDSLKNLWRSMSDMLPRLFLVSESSCWVFFPRRTGWTRYFLWWCHLQSDIMSTWLDQDGEEILLKKERDIRRLKPAELKA